ncbi:MAG: insulinase family protein [Pyrinomonadaceae bacterium]|nr:insulinase family protein [Pyrinomonadaceae bacterium]MCX7640490.1 insulinase family protein [Pyrinomonadaceae bacterium]MDW8305187.1 pitrilysin family protein [Acidobacteriota bacterium]
MNRVLLSIFLIVLMCSSFSQELPPLPSKPKPIKIPPFREAKLDNGLRVAVIEKRGVPLVSLCLVVRGGASMESSEKAGLARMTAELLTRGTTTRTAEQIAEEVEFLGGELSSWADWNASYLLLEISSDKLDRAMPVFSDVVLNPSFRQKEIEILRSQLQDSLSYNLKQPGFLASYVASVFAYGEHPVGGTPESLKSITRQDIVSFYKSSFLPQNSVLVISGDISYVKATTLAKRFFDRWSSRKTLEKSEKTISHDARGGENNFLIVDLPGSGQAAVFYAKGVGVERKQQDKFFEAQVANSVLGGGYSSRLNQEIRIKRGLSYGAGSSFAWRANRANFAARAQTKNESAAEVAELILSEIKRLSTEDVPEDEVKPRKAALIGNFARQIETNQGLARYFAELHALQVEPQQIQSFVQSVESVKQADLKKFASVYLNDGFFVIVGDYSKIRGELEKRFPQVKPLVIQADKLSLETILGVNR